MKGRFVQMGAPIVLGILLIGGGLYAWQDAQEETLRKAVLRCNVLDPLERFSCYRVAIERFYDEETYSIEGYMSRIEQEGISFAADDTTYAIFGTNCHTFYHALGDFAATYLPEKGDMFQQGSPKCTEGFHMGYFKRSALNAGFDLPTLQYLYEECKMTGGRSCAHETGHVLHDKYNVSILEKLDQVSRKTFGYEYPIPYTYQVLERGDLSMAFRECDEIVPESVVSFCYTGIGHNMFLFSEFVPDGLLAQMAECTERASSEYRDECYSFLLFRIGINRGAPEFLAHRLMEGNAACGEAVALISREDLLFHCYRGIGGGIGLFVESEYPPQDFREEDLLGVSEGVRAFMGLCDGSREEFVRDCYKGLLGTKFRQYYETFELNHAIIEEVLPTITEEDSVIG